MKSRAFTLIELLVVVLIIGILASIALPQYTKAVEKSRTVEAQLISSSVSQAVDEYLLANGLPTSGQLELLASSTNEGGQVGILSIDAESILDCVSLAGGSCVSKHFVYDAYCQSTHCRIRAKRYLKSDFSDRNDHYMIDRRYEATAGTWGWKTRCLWRDEWGKKICTLLSKEGWTLTEWV